VAAIIASVLYYTTGRTSAEEIYTKYYKPYEMSMRVRSADNSTNKMLTKAISLYDSGNFKEAAVLFEKVLACDSTKMAINLYSGISSMEIKEYNDADRSFNRIIDHNNNPYIEQAQWYLGFCYLMTNKTKLARQQFKAIANSNSFYKKDADKIYRKIKRMN
jgi:tetratricopeptide (TPR) repeat protein